MTRVALVRRPSPRLGDGIVTFTKRQTVDVELALEQWGAYVAALRDAGWEVREVEADESPDSVFVEDVLVVCDGVAVVTNPGAPVRRRELAGAERAAASLGCDIRRIVEPATLDGGDVLRAGETFYVGVGGRTNEDGARQLGRLLDARVVPTPIAGFLHLKTVATELPDGSFVAWAPLAPAGLEAVAMPEPSGAQVVSLGVRRVLLAADCPRSADLLATRGLEPVVVDIGEFQKLEGCVTCLSVLAN